MNVDVNVEKCCVNKKDVVVGEDELDPESNKVIPAILWPSVKKKSKKKVSKFKLPKQKKEKKAKWWNESPLDFEKVESRSD